jgi:drug/metabolite transporter (DMT)-like permease
MNNQTKGVLFALCATLLWSVNFVIASGIKGHIPPVEWLWRWTIACVFSPLPLEQNRKYNKTNIRFLAVTAVLE